MNNTRWARAAAAGALIIVLSAALGGCKVDKTELAQRVDLRNVDLRAVPDGVYESSYTIVVPSAAANKTVRVRVTVVGGRYQRIEILQPAKLGEARTFKALISKIEESQTLSLDAVSGATITSTAILKAIQTAVSSPGR